jgi:hypothetical protein
LEAQQFATEPPEIDAGVVGDEHLVAQRVAQLCLDVRHGRSVHEMVVGDPVDAAPIGVIGRGGRTSQLFARPIERP